MLEERINPITQVSKHEKLTEQYNFVSTENIIEKFQAKGWNIATTSMVNSKKYNGHQKHVVRLRNNDFKIDNDFIDIVLTNSHHGATSLIIQAGIFRVACSNGLIIGESFVKHRIPHKGFTYNRLECAIQDIESKLPQLNIVVKRMKEIVLSADDQYNLASKLVGERLKDISNLTDFARFLFPQREQDTTSDLWTVYNKIQEQVINGGISYTIKKKVKVKSELDPSITFLMDKESTRYSRPVKSIDKVKELNEYMFNEAVKLAA
jgi:hypothetical protein